MSKNLLLKKLREIRAEENVALRPTGFLRSTYIGLDGQSHPLKIRNYQAQLILNFVLMPRFVCGDDTGLGKSLCVISALTYLAKKDPTLKVMIVTLKSVTTQWMEEFQRFTEDGVFRCILGGDTPKKRVQAYKEWQEEPGRCVLITRYGSIRRDVKILSKFSGFVLVADEAAEFATPTSQINQAMRLLSERATHFWALTATPIQNNLLEGYGIFSVVVPGIFPPTKQGFEAQYCVMRSTLISGRKIQMLVGYRHGMVDTFRTQIEPFFLARSKTKVAKELPSVIMVRHAVPMSPDQSRLYAAALAKVEGPTPSGGIEDDWDLPEAQEQEAVSKLAVLTECQQIANHPKLIGEDGVSSKLEMFFELLEEGPLKDQKVLVFSRFRTLIDILSAECAARGIESVRITGSEDDKQRERARADFFSTEKNVRVCFITKAGGVGLNLQIAKGIIFFDSPWSGGVYQQLLGRASRMGSTHDRIYAIHLVSLDTIDEDVLKKLAKKLLLISQVVGDRPTLETMGSMSEIQDLYEAVRARMKASQGN